MSEPQNKTRQRKWLEANRESERQRKAAWRRDNPEPNAAYWASFREANRERLRAQNSLRRAACGPGVSPREWALILEYFGNVCAYCLRPSLRLQRDHLVPIAKGGEETVDNLVPACGPCNKRKGSRLLILMGGRSQ